ncbi:hypothetical protein BSL78_18007 [Apostichopus japonicus]|uniref:Uncharacterized protein n=1 Tax=Stichopus japonicus TaxID=307972 RepID=A0A2G8KAT1_STIJA|nr:hypothetical protein BSL78_18007 [Apostichopus japonicus]
MYRAWKNPDIDFSFGAARFTLFGKFGMYPVSVNGLANDHQAFNFWLVEKYQSSKDEMTGDNGPLGLIDAVPYPGDTYTLVYVDLSDYKDDLVPSELPADIDPETDQTLTFTLYIVNNVTEKHCGFNLTVIEGEISSRA